MAHPVHCDICGKLFSSSYVGSHKRLAHHNPATLLSDEKAVLDKMYAFFKTLSAERQKEILKTLAAIAKKAK